MALQGTIDAFPVVDVLQLLAGSRKTGRLIVEGDRSTAQLFVVDGSATGGGVQGVDDSALVALRAWLKATSAQKKSVASSSSPHARANRSAMAAVRLRSPSITSFR